MTFDLQWTAAAGHDPQNIPTDDPIAFTVHKLRPEVRKIASEAVTALSAVRSRADLSDIGKAQAKADIGLAAIKLIHDRTSMTAARTEAVARRDAAPVPGMESVPAPLVQPLLTALASIDPLMREAMALDWIKDGDPAPATLLVHATGPLALLDKAARSRLSEALRTAGNGSAAAKARQLTDALESTDSAARAGISIITKAAGIRDTHTTATAARGVA